MIMMTIMRKKRKQQNFLVEPPSCSKPLRLIQFLEFFCALLTISSQLACSCPRWKFRKRKLLKIPGAEDFQTEFQLKKKMCRRLFRDSQIWAAGEHCIICSGNTSSRQLIVDNSSNTYFLLVNNWQQWHFIIECLVALSTSSWWTVLTGLWAACAIGIFDVLDNFSDDGKWVVVCRKCASQSP